MRRGGEAHRPLYDWELRRIELEEDFDLINTILRPTEMIERAQREGRLPKVFTIPQVSDATGMRIGYLESRAKKYVAMGLWKRHVVDGRSVKGMYMIRGAG